MLFAFFKLFQPNFDVISVIVPIYNSERLLRRCINSILTQTLTDFELLLIDDGSNDSSGAICDEYSAKDSRVHVFHKPNGGVSSARNLGLDNAHGEWISFVDSDDWVSESYLSNLFENSEGVDLVFNYATRHENGNVCKEKYPPQLINSQELNISLRHNELNWHTSPWSKLFKKELIDEHGLRFPMGMHIGEDAVFLFSYIFNCSTIRFICTCDYQYLIDSSESLTKRLNSFASEHYGYIKIKEVSDRLRKYCDSDPVLTLKVDWLQGSYLRRSLNALYHDNISRSKRIKFLKQLDFQPYLTGITENSIQGKIYQWLLRHRMIKSYDFLRHNIVNMLR